MQTYGILIGVISIIGAVLGSIPFLSMGLVLKTLNNLKEEKGLILFSKINKFMGFLVLIAGILTGLIIIFYSNSALANLNIPL